MKNAEDQFSFSFSEKSETAHPQTVSFNDFKRKKEADRLAKLDAAVAARAKHLLEG